MKNQIVAKTLTGLAPTNERGHCLLSYVREDGDRGSLVFPLDQLDAFLAFALQIERKRVEKSEDTQGAKQVLLANNVEVSIEPKTQMLLLDFQVDKMRFAFALPREHAVSLATIIRERLPTH